MRVVLSDERTISVNNKILDQKLYDEFAKESPETSYEKHQIRYIFNHKKEVEFHLSIISTDKNLNYKSSTYEADILQSSNLKFEIEVESIGDTLITNNNSRNYYKMIMNQIIGSKISVISEKNRQEKLYVILIKHIT